MTIPREFAGRVIKMRGKAGEAWLESIAATIDFCESHWKIKITQPFDLNANFVAASTDGELVVKICLPGGDFVSELRTLQHYRGEGLCRLADFLHERQVLLLEALDPGRSIATLDEDSAISAVCFIIQAMRNVTLPVQHRFATIAEWVGEPDSLKSNLRNHSTPIGSQVLDRVERILQTLLRAQRGVYLLHGDLHHENVLSHQDHWKAIDPKGVIGETEFEVVPFLMNNISNQDPQRVIDYRVERFSKMLGLEADRVYAWGLVRSVMAAWWNVEDRLGLSEMELRLIDLFDRKVRSSIA